MKTTDTPSTDARVELRQRNVRLALILASVVAVFFLGFVVKVMWLGAPARSGGRPDVFDTAVG